jgi:molybdopterin synthase catalytic subunit
MESLNENSSYYLINEPIDINKYYSMVLDPVCGAVSMFSGTTRNYFSDKNVVKLEYEAYHEMAFQQFKIIETELREKWNIEKLVFVHRLGEVLTTESSVFIAISSRHRADSLEACNAAIYKLKSIVPIWKKEHYEDGSSWKENTEFLDQFKDLYQ